jgi:hypothetical protein
MWSFAQPVTGVLKSLIISVVENFKKIRRDGFASIYTENWSALILRIAGWWRDRAVLDADLWSQVTSHIPAFTAASFQTSLHSTGNDKSDARSLAHKVPQARACRPKNPKPIIVRTKENDILRQMPLVHAPGTGQCEEKKRAYIIWKRLIPILSVRRFQAGKCIWQRWNLATSSESAGIFCRFAPPTHKFKPTSPCHHH